MRRESSATYWIRRLVAILVLAAVVAVAAVVIVPALDGSDDDAAAPEEEQTADGEAGEPEPEPEPEPLRLTVSVSGDMLIHSPVWAQALALGGGQTYDFTPMFEELGPYVEGVDRRALPPGDADDAGPADELSDLQHPAGACGCCRCQRLGCMQHGIESLGRPGRGGDR